MNKKRKKAKSKDEPIQAKSVSDDGGKFYFNPLFEFLIRDRVTDMVYQPIGIQMADNGQGYYIHAATIDAAGASKHPDVVDGNLRFTPSYIDNLVWIRKIK